MKRLMLFFGVIFFSFHFSVLRAYPLLANVSARKSISLDGEWKYIVDPMETGYYDYRRQVNKAGFFQDKSPQNPDLIEYNFDAAASLNVPGDWNSQKTELLNYEGTVWYRKKITYLSSKEERRIFVYFGAVNYETIVFLNGKEIGRHEGGFTPFNFEITDKIKAGVNSLILKVNNTRKKENIPTDNFDWWNYGGITRSVSIIEMPKTFIRNYSIQLSKVKKGYVIGKVILDGKSSQNSSLKISIPELKKTIQVVTDKSGLAVFEINANPELWSPEFPKLYDVELSTDSDKITDQIGFRTITTQGNKLLLNGKQIFCRGVCVHDEAPNRGGRISNIEDVRTLIKWAKDMNCNFLRLAHYTHNENMIREAEKQGIMIWSEIPVYWTIDWDNPNTLQNAKRQMEEMIDRDINRCNIIIWSVANETPKSSSRLHFLKEVITHTHLLDSTRLISAALEKEQITPELMTVNDELGESLDVLSFNQYTGWYGGTPENCDKINWKLPTNKPIIISEFGGSALANKHGEKTERWTEEFQEDLYTRTLAMYRRTEGISGTAPWILIDFRSPKRLLDGLQNGYNRKGLISESGEKKKAFFVMKKWYEELKNNNK